MHRPVQVRINESKEVQSNQAPFFDEAKTTTCATHCFKIKHNRRSQIENYIDKIAVVVPIEKRPVWYFDTLVHLKPGTPSSPHAVPKPLPIQTKPTT